MGSVEDSARLLEEAARLQPDVIVLDLFMPAMNGLDACRELTRMLPRTRIIVLTAEDDADIKQVALAAGAFAFIEKRAIAPDLLPAVRAACGSAAVDVKSPERQVFRLPERPSSPSLAQAWLTFSLVPR